MSEGLAGRYDYAVLFVGTAVPDVAEFRSGAFSRAGNLFQLGILTGLRDAGVEALSAVSVLPVPSFRGEGPLVVRPKRLSLVDGVETVLLPFLNVTPLKQGGVGLAAAAAIARWALRNRRRRRIVYTYNVTLPPGVFTLGAGVLTRTRVVASLNDVNVPGHTVPDTALFRLDHAMHKVVAPRLDAIVYVSDAIRDTFAGSKPSLRVEGGIWDSMLERTSVRRTTERDKFIIASAGSLDHANGIDVLVEAFRRLPGDRYRLRIAGGGPLEALVRQAAALDRRIEYLGFRPLDDVLAMYADADVLVNMRMTKTIDTRYFFPSKMMEFLASGTPVISTCAGHIEQEFGRFVFLLRDESPEGLRAALSQLSMVPIEERLRLGQEARRYMTSEKTWRVQGRKIAAFLDALE